MANDHDVVVAGGGPAGLAATAALAQCGLSVGCVNPTQPPRWPNTYGMWFDELEDHGLTDCAGRTWETARVAVRDGAPRSLDRRYTLLDRTVLRRRLRDRAERGDVEWIEGVATDATAREEGVTVERRGDSALRARLVVDATGHDPVLCERPGSGSPGYQTAHGVVAECRPAPCDDDEMVLMDFRDGHLDDEAARDGPPTFLYAMEVGPGRYLLEETTLVARPAVDFERLERRLERRIEHAGYEIDVVDDERVRIPMGLPLTPPDRQRGIVPFGGAASLVHPATGYMVERTLERAAPMAEAIAEALRGAVSPGRVAGRAWRAVWPRERRRARELLSFGMEVLIGLDARQTASFFDAFFSLGRRDWGDYMSGRVGPGRVASIMWRVFDRIDLGLKGRLAREVLSGSGTHLVRSLTA